MRDIRIINKSQATNQQCGFCKNKITAGLQLEVEERTTWFRGDDEIYFVHKACYDKEEAKERAKQDRIAEQEAKASDRRYARLLNLETELYARGIPVQKHNDDQHWVIAGKLDWWPHTGTAIMRGTKRRYHINSKDGAKIIKLVE